MERVVLKIFVVFTLASVIVLGAEEDDRPYQFEFKVPGIQHRYESKDQRGIVTGEFGFITADGTYHITDYATDELGNFKIFGFKNIPVGFPYEGGPEQTYLASRQGESSRPLVTPPSTPARPTTPIPTRPTFTTPRPPSPTSPPIHPGSGSHALAVKPAGNPYRPRTK